MILFDGEFPMDFGTTNMEVASLSSQARFAPLYKASWDRT